MVFRELEIGDKDIIEQSLKRVGIINCDLTFANLYCWKDTYKVNLSVIDDSIIIRYCYDEGSFTYSIIADKEKFPKLFDLVNDSDKSAIFYSLDSNAKEYLRLHHPQYGFHFDRKRSEYIYRRDDLVGLHGGHLKAKRNHMNRFRSMYDFKYQPLSSLDATECMKLLEIWSEEHVSQGLFDREEVEKEITSIKRAFDHFDELGLIGGSIRIGEKIVAFCYGSEISNDTFCVHIEKADINYEGIFVAINQQFAEHLPAKYIFIDREEDLGIPGLRYSKESYHPCGMIDKYLTESMTSQMTMVKQLWMECFTEDSDEDAEQFLFTSFNPEHMLSISKENRIISMLHIMPFNDKAYCFLVSTHPKYRDRGYATTLFNKAIEFCRGKGYIEIVIIPANDELRKWYKSLGCYGDFPVRFNNSEIADACCSNGCCIGTGDISKDIAVVYPLTAFRHGKDDKINLF